MNSLILKISVLIWKTLMLLPRGVHLIFARLVGIVLLRIPFKRNKYSKANIDLCFNNLSSEERKIIYKKNILFSGNILFDTGIAWFWSDKRIRNNLSFKLNGIEHLRENQKNKTGVLLFFKHSLHLELDSRIIGMHCDLYGIEREHNSKAFTNIQRKGRLRGLKGVTDRKNTLTFIKWLKKGKTVLYAPDQDYGLNKSIVVDFFGHPSATISAPFKLINTTNSKPYFVNSYYDRGCLVIDIEEINFDYDDPFKFMQNLNIYIEQKIRSHPHEYLWQHRRFKSTLGKDRLYK